VGKESLAQAFLPPTPDFDNRARFSSRILVLKNMVKITDLEIDEDYEDMVEDVMEECKKYGRVISIVIPRPGIHTSLIGKIFIEYPVVEETHKAKIDIGIRQTILMKLLYYYAQIAFLPVKQSRIALY
jgi:hypothetical protein